MARRPNFIKTWTEKKAEHVECDQKRTDARGIAKIICLSVFVDKMFDRIATSLINQGNVWLVIIVVSHSLLVWFDK